MLCPQEALSSALGLNDCVDFCVNAPFSEVQQLLGGAVGGLHTMVDEHFGISIVEYMAAGDSALHQILYLACEVQFWHFAIMCAFFSYTMCL